MEEAAVSAAEALEATTAPAMTNFTSIAATPSPFANSTILPTPWVVPTRPADIHEDLVAKAANPEMFASLSILLQTVLLGAAFVIGHVLRRRRIYMIHEAGTALLMGVLVGLLSRIFDTEEEFRRWLNFKEEFFFLFLLPPIIFMSGFSLQPKPFFANLGAICMFAFLGTFVAAIVTGIIVWIAGFIWLSYPMPFLESLMFGALISATDPVTVLAIFQELGGDTNLYSYVFGESVLNDAVAIVLYRTLLSFVRAPLGHQTITHAVGYFFVILGGSLAIGAFVALLCALLFKHAGLAVTNLHQLESCLVVLFPYCTYMLAEGFSLSGIVAILFNGVLMRHYAIPNLSERSQETVTSFFHILATMAETFVFIYMGVSIFNSEQSWAHISFTFWGLLAILVGRAANVFPCCYIVNLVRPASRQIPEAHQKALWFSGLRGAMAFALGLQSIQDLKPTHHGKVICSTTTALVCITVIFVGGSTPWMLGKLDLLGDDFEPLRGASMDGLDEDEDIERVANESDMSDAPSPNSQLAKRLKQFQRTAKQYAPEGESLLATMDKKYIRPFFTHSGSDDGDGEPEERNGVPLTPTRDHRTSTASSSHSALQASSDPSPGPGRVPAPSQPPAAGEGGRPPKPVARSRDGIPQRSKEQPGGPSKMS